MWIRLSQWGLVYADHRLEPRQVAPHEFNPREAELIQLNDFGDRLPTFCPTKAACSVKCNGNIICDLTMKNFYHYHHFFKSFLAGYVKKSTREKKSSGLSYSFRTDTTSNLNTVYWKKMTFWRDFDCVPRLTQTWRGFRNRKNIMSLLLEPHLTQPSAGLSKILACDSTHKLPNRHNLLSCPIIGYCYGPP